MKILPNLSTGKCPKCEKGDVFSSKGNIFLLQAPKMYDKCSSCGYTYEREPGYFLGAFYVSYGMTVFELLVTYILLQSFVSNVWSIIALMFMILVLLSFFNFRVARLMWINLFHK